MWDNLDYRESEATTMEKMRTDGGSVARSAIWPCSIRAVPTITGASTVSTDGVDGTAVESQR